MINKFSMPAYLASIQKRFNPISKERTRAGVTPFGVHHIVLRGGQRSYPLPVPVNFELASFVTAFVATYEKYLRDRSDGIAQLVHRDVLEDQSINARALPLCPEFSFFDNSPNDDLDWVSCVFECKTGWMVNACFVLRIHAKPGLVVCNLYETYVPTILGIIPLNVSGFLYSFAGVSGPSPSNRHGNNCLDRAQTYGVFVQAAVSAGLDFYQATIDDPGSWLTEEPKKPDPTPAPPPTVPDAPTALQKKVKRRSDPND